MPKQHVTFAYPVTVDGKDHKPNTTAEVEDHQAVALIASGKARKADAPKPSAPVVKESK